MASITLTLPDMHCGSCVNAVTRVAHRLDPAARLTADLASRAVTVEGVVAEPVLRAALVKAGFPPG